MKTRGLRCMGRRTALIAAAMMLLAAATAGAAAAMPRAPEAPALAKWTVIYYMNGDNDLEQWAAKDLDREIAAVGSTEDVQIVALADRTPGYDRSHGDWRGTLLFHVTKGMDPTPDNAAEDWGERNMGSPQTLIDLLRWARANYPAQRYALVLWDHAWAWRPSYLMWDQTSNDALDLPELRYALDVTGGVNAIAFDTCASQSIEVEAELRGYANAVAASEDFMGYTGFANDRVLAQLDADPAMNARKLASIFAASMAVGADEWTTTSAAVRLDGAWDQLCFAVDSLAWKLRDGLAVHRGEYHQAWHATLKMTGEPQQADLYDAVYEIGRRVTDRDIRRACDDVRRRLAAVTLCEWHRPYMKGAHGISIFWPHAPAPLHEPGSWWNFTYYASMLVFGQETGWDEFLAAWGE